MTCVAFFGHDAADAAVRRRVQGFRDDGLDVIGFMMRRRDNSSLEWSNIDLGKTFDGALGRRIGSIWRGARIAARAKAELAAADVLYARNLDMLATAFLARGLAGLKTPIIYEALDIHRLLTRNDVVGLTLRRIEGMLLSRCSRLVVSSPAFLENYYDIRHHGRYQASLIENRLAAGGDYGPRPDRATLQNASQPLRIGWVGVLRCWRSFGLLLEIARRYGRHVQIIMHGAPALTEIPDFHARIQGIPNVIFRGRYKAPEDLGAIYAGLDLVWAGDFMEAGFNSTWLLPNRLYEGGYYGAPPIAPSGTQTARWIGERGVGFLVEEDLGAKLPELIEHLNQHRDLIAARRARLLDLAADTFVAPRGELAALILDTLRDTRRQRSADLHQFSTRETGINPPAAAPHGAPGE